MKDELIKELDHIKQDLINMSDHLYDNPELGDQEYESMKLLTNYLEQQGFQVDKGIVDRPTAFKAEYKGEKPGPKIAYLAEYDALPGVGHGCGHNLIGTMSVGAAVILSKKIDQIGGSVVVLGTPAEETNGAKVPMSDEGIFSDIDAAMIVHPSDLSYSSGDSLAMDAIQFAYKGKSSHAAASPEKGINALDSVIQLFNGVNAIREHVTSDVRIHGIISEGGQAANVVPEYAVAQFYVRAKERNNLNNVVEKVRNIAQGAALMTGTTLEISNYELSYDNMITNKALSDAFNKNLEQVSGKTVLPPKQSYGSIDMGNVSQVVPAIHPYIGFGEEGLIAHTQEFADKTITAEGHQTLANGALSLALTGYDLLTDKALYQSIQQEFNSK
ncbi:M20 family metallopeptidase [Oceanobacillus manasiensis]|uniref:M20 family metallopeptidase n=1 Tax=Oceanobacillus manasiensis TaxID=586413 RepID=UPI0005A952B3|nr:M20 family metallopeptidase [Oceanobacillus manasiensis]